jgi:hypothetical protein
MVLDTETSDYVSNPLVVYIGSFAHERMFTDCFLTGKNARALAEHFTLFGPACFSLHPTGRTMSEQTQS